ncbi:MAG TPA: helix-turn-helix domain-containing protein [Candidatus Deferrimicrobiaceae bacterium]|nr:helix-turn-helix domain-containing protein [Candidatus Deferrimicrobiaceae bacterium]
MSTLAELGAELLPGARRVGRATGGDRQIAWVRVMRGRVPAFDALEPGDLVIVPAPALVAVAPAAPEVEALVGGLAAAPISGALLLEAESGAGTAALDQLGRALETAGLPGLRMARADVATLERAVIGFIVGRGGELERQTGLLEQELERRALEGGGAQELVATVAAFLGRAVVLESARGEAIVVHAPAEAPAAAAEAARYRLHGVAGLEPALRIELPSATGPAGRLAVLGAEPASELARVALPRVAGLLALELARDEAVRRAADRARRAEPMPSDGPPWSVLLTRQREVGIDDDSRSAREAREALRREVRLLAPARRMTLRGDADSLEIRAIVAGGEAAARELAERTALLLGRAVAISRPFDSPGERPAAEAEARSTLEAALALESPPSVARAARLPFYRMLGAVHNVPDGPRLALAVLEPLLGGRPAVARQRLQTLRALLDHGGVGEAAAALGVHRNTVAYRLRAIEKATGWQLGDPELRLPLSVALRLVQED